MSNIKITECRCCGNRDAKQFIEKGDGYICKCCGVWFRYETEEERDGCLSGYRQLRKYKFEDARDTFEEVLVNFPGSIDARWGLLLSRFGVVYIKGFYDNVIEPVYCFPDYEVLEGRTFQNEDEYREMRELIGSDTELKYFYDAKAREIDRAIKKFRDCKESTERDVFICVKISASTEKEKHGINERTKDYEFALRAYKALQARGLNVFFSFVTLKNEVNSDDLIWLNLVKSKKMLLIGSREDYLESAWVKSEWKRWRFLDRQRDMYICVLNEGGDNPKNVLPYELRKDAPQIYTPDTYSKLLDDICGVDYSATKAQATVAAPIAAEETSKQNEKVTDAARKKVLAKIEADEREKAEYAGKDGKVIYKDGREEILPHGTRLIKSKAYYSNLDVVKVIIPDSVTEIGGSAFFGCTSLESVIIPESVRFIGEWAFDLCSSMRHVTLPSGITNISSYSFLSTGIMSISIPAGVTYIRTHAFHGCHSLRDICFYGTEEEWEVIDVANNNDAITTATVHFVRAENKNIDGKIVFIDGREEVLKYGITKIEKDAYQQRNDIESVVLPNGVTEIASGAFSGCSRLESVVLPDGLTTIDSFAFLGCSRLENIIIPDSVTTINNGAFNSCSKLKEVKLPKNLSTVSNPFQWCKLKLSISEKNKNYIVKNNALYSKNAKRLIFYVAEENTTSFTVDNGVLDISEWAFFGCKNLTDIILTYSVITIGDNAFMNCENLESINIPPDVTRIGEFAFGRCRKLKSVNIPFGVKEILCCTFGGCKKFDHIIIPDSVTTIKNAAFAECENLKDVNIPSGVRVIDNDTFCNCKSLKSVHISENVTEIKGNPFAGCKCKLSISSGNKNFKLIDNSLYSYDEKTLIAYVPNGDDISFKIPKGVTTILRDAFNSNNTLQKIYIPISVTNIEDGAFNNNSAFSDVYYDGKAEDWEKISIGPFSHSLRSAKVHFKTLFGYTK